MLKILWLCLLWTQCRRYSSKIQVVLILLPPLMKLEVRSVFWFCLFCVCPALLQT